MGMWSSLSSLDELRCSEVNKADIGTWLGPTDLLTLSQKKDHGLSDCG